MPNRNRRSYPMKGIHVVFLICMNKSNADKAAEILSHIEEGRTLVKDLYMDSSINEEIAKKILEVSKKEMPNIRVLVLKNTNPNFRRLRDNEEMYGHFSDLTGNAFDVDLMYLEDKYKDDPVLQEKKVLAEADYGRASVIMMRLCGRDDQWPFIEKYLEEEVVEEEEDDDVSVESDDEEEETEDDEDDDFVDDDEEGDDENDDDDEVIDLENDSDADKKFTYDDYTVIWENENGSHQRYNYFNK